MTALQVGLNSISAENVRPESVTSPVPAIVFISCASQLCGKPSRSRYLGKVLKSMPSFATLNGANSTTPMRSANDSEACCSKSGEAESKKQKPFRTALLVHQKPKSFKQTRCTLQPTSLFTPTVLAAYTARFNSIKKAAAIRQDIFLKVMSPLDVGICPEPKP